MSKIEIRYMRIKKFIRLLISLIEYALALANVTGSQSDIIHYCMAMYLGQLIFRLFEVIELLSPSEQINNIYFHLQSTSMFVFVSQTFYMITTHIYYQSEKEEFAKHYVGELCDIMAYYWSQRNIVICSFIFALFLKQYNLYYLTYLEIHIEAKQKNLKVQDVIKLKYYTFFTETLRDSENTLSYFQKKRTYF